MKNTAFWKQVVLSGLLIAATGAAWTYRADLGALAGYSSSSSGTASEKSRGSRSTPVIVAKVVNVQDDLTFSAIGTGFALRAVTLRAPSGGEITSLAIAPGQKFSAGETLVRLDDTDEQLAVELAEARIEQATLERDRYRRLQDTGAAAIARLEQAETAYKIAHIELDKARADLADRRLRAPFDGVTGLATIETGDRIAVDDVIASFDDRSLILVEFDLPEALLGRVRPGLAISASTPAVEGRSFEGEITAIDSRVDPTTRTARIRASIDNSGDMLRPGTSFALRLDLPGNAYPAVPELALQFERGKLSLWRVTDGKAEPVAVRLVRRRAGLVIVDGPLAEGDWIVIEGTQRLRPSAPVDVLNTPDGGSS